MRSRQVAPGQQTRHQVPCIQPSLDSCTCGAGHARTLAPPARTSPMGDRAATVPAPSLSDDSGCPQCRLLRLNKQVRKAGSVTPSARQVSLTPPFLAPVFPKPERRGWALSLSLTTAAQRTPTETTRGSFPRRAHMCITPRGVGMSVCPFPRGTSVALRTRWGFW